MSDFNSLVQYTVENISRPVKYIIYKLTEFIRVVDKFVFRQVPTGAASGYANIEKMEGNTVAWNQLFPIPGSSKTINQNGVTITDNRDGSYTISTVSTGATANTYVTLITSINNFAIVGHKYLITGIRGGSASTYRLANMSTSGSGFNSCYNPTIFTALYAVGVAIQVFANAVITTPVVVKPQIIDLTAIFGAGNEPSTVADFEAWLAQNIGTLPYYNYNAGELLSVKMSGMQTEDSSQQTLDTLPFDVTTITGINPNTNTREVMFGSGMKQADYAGTVKDEIGLVNGTATVNVGSRAYQAGDESDPDVLTDGTTTYYALTTPIVYTDLQDQYGNPLNPRYKVEQGGTEAILPANTSTPTTVAPTLTTTYTKANN